MPPQVVHVKNAGKVAGALANPKCQKILDYLGKHQDATETKLSKELSIPLSTVHYNMKILVDAKLVLGDEYTYSPKGKEVTHYLMNKNPIVIIQEEAQLQVLKAIVPAAVLAAGLGIAYTLIKKPFTQAPQAAQMMIQSAPAADTAFETGGAMMKGAAQPLAESTNIIPQDMLPWFLAGIVTMLFISFLLAIVYRWREQRAH